MYTEPIFKTLKLLKVNEILKLQEYKFYFKFKNNKLPHYLQNLPMNGNINANSHATQTQNNIDQMRPIHVYARKCISYKVPITINNAPAEIVNTVYTHSLQGFAGYIKTKILQLYQETADCDIFLLEISRNMSLLSASQVY